MMGWTEQIWLLLYTLGLAERARHPRLDNKAFQNTRVLEKTFPSKLDTVSVPCGLLQGYRYGSLGSTAHTVRDLPQDHGGRHENITKYSSDTPRETSQRKLRNVSTQTVDLVWYVESLDEQVR
jgi:hypothetical protein